MTEKNLSLSLLLAIALGFSACGGGGATPQDIEPKGDEKKEKPDTKPVDLEGPVFSSSLPSTYKILEERSKEVATIEVTDDNPVTFELAGKDKDFFELTDTKVRSIYSTTLRFKNIPDYEVQSEYTVAVIATDSLGNSSQKTFHIQLENDPFAFDVTGNLGRVKEHTKKEINLTTVENQGNVEFSKVSGSDYFKVVNNVLVFDAPAFYNNKTNSYEATIEAKDLATGETIHMTVSAHVIRTSDSLTTNYLVETKREIDGIEYTEFKYKYSGHYLTEMRVSGTNYLHEEVRVFRYEDDHKIMKEYSVQGGREILKIIRVFEEKNTGKNKFPVNIKTRISAQENINYLSYVYDGTGIADSKHLTKIINVSDNGKFYSGMTPHKMIVYVYDDNDRLTRIITGSHSLSNNEVSGLTPTQLESEIVPTGGFPVNGNKMSTEQIASLRTNATLPFRVSYENTYVYGDDPTKIEHNFFGYAEPKNYKDTLFVKYFSNNVVNEIQLGKNKVKYGQDGLLQNINNFAYTYDESKTNISVMYNGEKVTTYIFKEE